MQAEAERCLASFLDARADLDLACLLFDEWGKGRIKRTMRVSPDAFFQVALQLAFYRVDANKSRNELTPEFDASFAGPKRVCAHIRGGDGAFLPKHAHRDDSQFDSGKLRVRALDGRCGQRARGAKKRASRRLQRASTAFARGAHWRRRRSTFVRPLRASRSLSKERERVSRRLGITRVALVDFAVAARRQRGA